MSESRVLMVCNPETVADLVQLVEIARDLIDTGMADKAPDIFGSLLERIGSTFAVSFVSLRSDSAELLPLLEQVDREAFAKKMLRAAQAVAH